MPTDRGQIWLPQPVIKLLNLGFIQEQIEFLFFDIDRSHYVLMLQLKGYAEEFTEDIELAIPAYEKSENRARLCTQKRPC